MKNVRPFGLALFIALRLIRISNSPDLAGDKLLAAE